MKIKSEIMNFTSDLFLTLFLKVQSRDMLDNFSKTPVPC